MAALTDGTQAGTIESSPVVPAPVAADTSTGAGNPLTGQDATAKIPTTTVSSKTASDYVTDKITPTLANASTEIANNNQKMATALPPDDPTNKFNTATGQANSKYVDPNPPTNTDSAGPNPGYKFAYDTGGNQSQIPIEDPAATYGLSDTNPKAGPTTKVSGSVTDTTGDTYKQFADGTYGMYDAAGKYQGVASSQDFQNAQDATSLLSSLHQLANGSYPLTVDQQAQIAGLQATFKGLIDEQKVSNQNLTGGTTVAMNLYGMGNSIAGLGIIKGTVDSGLQKIADLNTKLVTAVAQMKAGFQKDNYDMIKGAYDEYNQAAKDKQAQLDKITKEASDAAAAVQDRKDKLRQYNLDVSKFQETKDQDSFDRALKTEQEAFDEKYKSFTSGMGGGNSTGGISSSASMGAAGAPDPVSQQQVMNEITQKYGPMTATAIKGLANYDMNPTDWSTRSAKGMSRETAVSLAKMYDPTYNDSQFAARSAYIKGLASTASGTVGAAINSANKSINHLTTFLNISAQLGNGASQTVNSLINPVLGLDQARRQKLDAADTAGLGVADELAKFFKGTGSTDVASIEAWRSKLNSNTSPGAQKGLAQGAIDLLAGQLQTLSEQYTSAMGKAPTSSLIGPSAMANLSRLKNEGYEVNIPGVYFTDKDAYLKNDPSATTNMSAAFNNLKAIGVPTTPENILQAAQLTQ